MTRPIKEWECGKLSWDEWVEEYKPVTDLLDIGGEDYALVMRAYDRDPSVVWTLLDCDGVTVLVSGWHYVNRIGYYLTSEGVPDMVSIEVEDS